MKSKIDSKSLLHSRQLKSTPLREAILNILHKNEKPLSAEEISFRMKHLEFDQASLFRSLKAMTEKEVINQVDLGEGFYRYEAHCEHHSHHHHIMCNSCKKITVLPFCISPKIVAYLKKAGYSELSHRMDFFGICKACSK
jgi:Fur family ferric uptake transcriptional regulator